MVIPPAKWESKLAYNRGSAPALLKEAMTKSSPLSHISGSKFIMLALLLGNVALGITTIMQSRVIAGQTHIIRLLYQDSAELANMKIAANMAKAKKP